MTSQHKRNTISRIFVSLSMAVSLATITACDIKPISELTADEGITRLRGLRNDESWERLIQEVNEYRSRFPYSQYASEAELMQADAYFKTKRYPECIANYDDFLRRNPNHSQADFALFRIAKSYDLQSPEEVDREQATTQKAIEKYKDLIQRFPRSGQITESQQRMADLKRRVAEHHLFIGNFYWKKDLWHGALTRYLFVADSFAEMKDLQSIALTKASDAYLKLADQLQKNPKSDELSFFRSSTPEQLKLKSIELLERKKVLNSGSLADPANKEG